MLTLSYSGLACSSRNQLLGDRGRQAAAVLYQALQAGQAAFQAGECRGVEIIMAVTRCLLQEPVVQMEYLELVDGETLEPVEQGTDKAVLAVAACVEGVRLIDNLPLAGSLPGRDAGAS